MSALILTDWIPCTTPPVRDGEYEFQMIKNGSPQGIYRGLYKSETWTSPLDGKRLGAIPMFPLVYQWRGIRQYVLTNGEEGDEKRYRVQGEVVGYWHPDPIKAIGFATEQEALCYSFGFGAAENVTVVLP